jgi:hypothetical protein
LAIHLERQPNLLRVVQTLGLTRLLARLREHRKQNRRQYRDNRNHNQQLDQGESSSHDGASRVKYALLRGNPAPSGTLSAP